MAVEYQNSSYRDNRYSDNRDDSRSKGDDYSRGGYNSGGGSWGGSRDNRGSWGSSNENQGLGEVDWSKKELSPFQKDFYTESSVVRDMTQHDVDEFRREHQIVVSGRHVPKPIPSFEASGFPRSVLDELTAAGFPTPTAVQCQAWPIAMKGHDLISIAATGSGKTLAFLLPGIVHIQAQPRLQRGDGPIALVLAPTRELACQILAECEKFGRSSGIRAVCCYGGVPKGQQARDLRYGAEIVIATPGRLIDFLEFGTTNLHRVTYLVLDEADRMLDMGFEPQVRKISSQIRPDRQSLFFSATWPKEVQALARELCKEDPVQTTIGSAGKKANEKIHQNVIVCDEGEKLDRLKALMETIVDNTSKIIIFAETKRGTDSLQRSLKASGVAALAIHGDKNQQERDWTLHQFKSGRCMVLIATDVASRGLDVKDITCVINYDFPKEIESYIHRIGRTARGTASGTAYSFFTRDNAAIAFDLIKILSDCKQQVPAELEALNTRRPAQNNSRWGNNRGSWGNKGSWGGNNRGGNSWGGNNRNRW